MCTTTTSQILKLLELDNSVAIHHRNTRLLPMELDKVKCNLPNQAMS